MENKKNTQNELLGTPLIEKKEENITIVSIKRSKLYIVSEINR
jgi:hypothetical protein